MLKRLPFKVYAPCADETLDKRLVFCEQPCRTRWAFRQCFSPEGTTQCGSLTGSLPRSSFSVLLCQYSQPPGRKIPAMTMPHHRPHQRSASYLIIFSFWALRISIDFATSTRPKARSPTVTCSTGSARECKLI